MKPVIFIFGPTASGKTGLSLALAHRFDGEIIGADSMQIYRKMDIGTAKASAEERAAIPHHLIDICDFDEPYSVAQYRKDALRAIRDIHKRNKLPIVVGGTGLYFDALLYEPSYGNVQAQPELRDELKARIKAEGSIALHRELETIDPVTAGRIHVNDEKRMIRALEIYHSTGKIPSVAQTRKKNEEFSFLSFFLNYSDRQKLYEACDRRVDEMIADGLLDEVKRLLDDGLAESPTASQAIGYKELIDYYGENATLGDSVELIKRRTRNYAKRQITWFSKSDAILLCSEDTAKFSLAVEHTLAFLKGVPC